MRNILNTIKHEVLDVIPPAIFLLISFCLLILTHNLLSRQYGNPFKSCATALVTASCDTLIKEGMQHAGHH
jgi:hypothetical protein